MAKIKQSIKFPCGLKIKEYEDSWYCDRQEYPLTTICPLHGKNCKR
jgi:hypothetical protein